MMEEDKSTSTDFSQTGGPGHSGDPFFALQAFSDRLCQSANDSEIVKLLFNFVPEIFPAESCELYIQNRDKFHLVDRIQYNASISTADPQPPEILEWCSQRGTVALLPEENGEGGQALIPIRLCQKAAGIIVLSLGQMPRTYSESLNWILSVVGNSFALAYSRAQLQLRHWELTQAIEELKIYWNRVFSSVTIPLIALDSSGKIIVMNQKAEEIFSLSAKVIEGQPFSVVFPEELKKIFTRFANDAQKGLDTEDLIYQVSVGGISRKISISSYILDIPGKARKGLVALCRTVSDSSL